MSAVKETRELDDRQHLLTRCLRLEARRQRELVQTLATYGTRQSITRALYFALIAARVGVVAHQGIAYALTWDAGE